MVERGGGSTDAKILPVLHTGKTAKQTTCEHQLHARRGTKGYIWWTNVSKEEGTICQTKGSIYRVDQNEKEREAKSTAQFEFKWKQDWTGTKISQPKYRLKSCSDPLPSTITIIEWFLGRKSFFYSVLRVLVSLYSRVLLIDGVGDGQKFGYRVQK